MSSVFSLVVLCLSHYRFVVIQSLRVQLVVTPWTAAQQVSLSFTKTHNFLQFMSIELMMWSNHLILCHPLSPFALSLSQHQSLSYEMGFRIKWLKYWSIRFYLSPSNEYSELISFRIDWFNLLEVQGTVRDKKSIII